MMELATTQADESRKIAEPVRTVTLCKCEIKLDRVCVVGEPELLTLYQARDRLAPSRTSRACMNIVNARPGWYIGLLYQGKNVAPSNFLFKNPTRNGDIRWLLQAKPEFEDDVLELYYVKDVEIPRGTEGGPAFQRGRPRT